MLLDPVVNMKISVAQLQGPTATPIPTAVTDDRPTCSNGEQ